MARILTKTEILAEGAHDRMKLMHALAQMPRTCLAYPLREGQQGQGLAFMTDAEAHVLADAGLLDERLHLRLDALQAALMDRGYGPSKWDSLSIEDIVQKVRRPIKEKG